MHVYIIFERPERIGLTIAKQLIAEVCYHQGIDDVSILPSSCLDQAMMYMDRIGICPYLFPQDE
jgi:hypothetical protein